MDELGGCMPAILHQSAQALGVTPPAPSVGVRLQCATDAIQIIYQQVQTKIGFELCTPDLHTERVHGIPMQAAYLASLKAHTHINQSNFGYLAVFAKQLQVNI
jgi:hypothetical protein